MSNSTKPQRFNISIKTPNKRRNSSILCLWSKEYDALSKGDGQFEIKHWMDKITKRTAKNLKVCEHHLTWEVSLKNEENGKYEKYVILDEVAQSLTNPLYDRIQIKLEEEACLDSTCTIAHYSSFNAIKANNKRRNEKLCGNKRKRQKIVESEIDEEFIDAFSTDSDEYDLLKRPTSTRRSTGRNKETKSTKLWQYLLAKSNEKFKHLLTTEGCIKLVDRAVCK